MSKKRVPGITINVKIDQGDRLPLTHLPVLPTEEPVHIVNGTRYVYMPGVGLVADDNKKYPFGMDPEDIIT